MVKKAKQRDPKRIKELKAKILTEVYLQLAITRIAALISMEILGL